MKASSRFSSVRAGVCGETVPLYMTAICGVLAAALIATERAPALALAAAE